MQQSDVINIFNDQARGNEKNIHRASSTRLHLNMTVAYLNNQYLCYSINSVYMIHFTFQWTNAFDGKGVLIPLILNVEETHYEPTV